MATPLLPHQKQALSWMCARENKSTLPPFWEKRGELYCNSLTCFYTKERPERVCGGILADDMGLVSNTGGLCCPVLMKWLNTNMIPPLGKDSDHHCAHPYQLSLRKPSACGDICKCSRVVLCLPLPSDHHVLIQMFYVPVHSSTSLPREKPKLNFGHHLKVLLMWYELLWI